MFLDSCLSVRGGWRTLSRSLCCQFQWTNCPGAKILFNYQSNLFLIHVFSFWYQWIEQDPNIVLWKLSEKSSSSVDYLSFSNSYKTVEFMSKIMIIKHIFSCISVGLFIKHIIKPLNLVLVFSEFRPLNMHLVFRGSIETLLLNSW